MKGWDWEYITGSLATIVATLFAFYKKYSAKRQGKIFEEALIETLKDKIAVHDELSKLRSVINAPRIVLYESKNGGGIPKGANPVYLSIFDESYDSNMRSVKDDIKHKPSDMAKNKMLLRILEDNYIFQYTNGMANGNLKDRFVADGIQCSYMYKVGALKDKFLFLSVEWQDLQVDDAKYRSEISSKGNNILNILTK